MKIHSTFHFLVLLMAVLTFSLPFTQHPLQAEQPQGRGFAAGSATQTQGSSCLIPGVNTASTSHVPRVLYAHQLLGKSPEYIVNYTQTANPTTVVNDLIDRLPTGCVVAAAIVVIVGGLYFLSILDPTSDFW